MGKGDTATPQGPLWLRGPLLQTKIQRLNPGGPSLTPLSPLVLPQRPTRPLSTCPKARPARCKRGKIKSFNDIDAVLGQFYNSL